MQYLNQLTKNKQQNKDDVTDALTFLHGVLLLVVHWRRWGSPSTTFRSSTTALHETQRINN